jgi:DNA-binding NtrC family response regulator
MRDARSASTTGWETHYPKKEVNPERVAVVVTGCPDDLSDSAREAMENDGYALLRKPFDIEDVLAWVREASKE